MGEEQQYLDLLQKILDEGQLKKNRTGTDTLYIPGHMMKFNIKDQFMLLTTKKVYLRGIFEELKLFLAGDTDTKKLEAKKVNIWKGNTSREFLDNRGLHSLPEGDLGCTYPHQWRNFNGEHPCLPETKGLKGVDQIQKMIDLLRNDPASRRIYLTAINPAQEHLMSLPACHCVFQVIANPETKELDSILLVRSNDIFLGAPFNIAQYNLLAIYLAAITGYAANTLTYFIGDAHLYTNHIEAARTQIARKPRKPPALLINKEIRTLDDVLNLEFEDLELVGYKPYPRIKAKMAV